jgi:hypothetical protein
MPETNYLINRQVVRLSVSEPKRIPLPRMVPLQSVQFRIDFTKAGKGKKGKIGLSVKDVYERTIIGPVFFNLGMPQLFTLIPATLDKESKISYIELTTELLTTFSLSVIELPRVVTPVGSTNESSNSTDDRKGKQRQNHVI